MEDHNAEMLKLVAEHEAELEKKEEKIREAREFAQEISRKYKLAERDYDEAKKSVALTGAHAKEMEEEQESWKKFLQAMDKQLSSKLLLRLLFTFVSSPSIYTFSFGLRSWDPCFRRESCQGCCETSRNKSQGN